MEFTVRGNINTVLCTSHRSRNKITEVSMNQTTVATC